MSALVLVGWAIGAFFGLGLACYSATDFFKAFIRSYYEDKHQPAAGETVEVLVAVLDEAGAPLMAVDGSPLLTSKEVPKPNPMDDKASQEHRRYRTQIRVIPNAIGCIVGGARWALVLVGYEGAEHFRLWPTGLMPLAGPVLGLGAGGLAMVIHDAIASSLPAAVRAGWSAVFTRGAGQRINLEATTAIDTASDSAEMVTTLEFDALPEPAEGTLEP